MRRIICIGNRYVPEDAAGFHVYRRLLRRCPEGVEVIDGGLQGLNLLPLVEGAERVVFVDRVVPRMAPEGVVVLDGAEVAALADGDYGHSAGLPYLLRVLPAVCVGAVPRIDLVGIGRDDEPTFDVAATLALELVLENGHRTEVRADGPMGQR